MDKAKNVSLRKLLIESLGTVLGLVILVVMFTALSNILPTSSNIRNILTQSDINTIIAIGMTYIIISGNIDISVGTSLALSSYVGATLMVGTDNVGSDVAVMLPTGILLGLLNGSSVVYLGFPPFTVTLSTMRLFRGMAYLYTGGQTVVGLPQRMTGFATGGILCTPNIVWLIVIVYTIGYVALWKVMAGRKVCAVGDNLESVRFFSINVERVTLAAFMLSGFYVALGGIAYMERLDSGQPIVGQSYEIYTIAVAVIGGANPTKGGIRSMVGILIGAIFISVLQNELTILNVNTYRQQVCVGVVLLLTVDLDWFRRSVK